jgi:YD repeat-containing protein
VGEAEEDECPGSARSLGLPLTSPGTRTVTSTSDDFGRLQTVQDWNNRTTTYTYGENGQLKTIVRPDGTLREQSYDAAGQLRVVRETRAGALFAFQELRHDADGRIEYSRLHPMPAAVTLSADTLDSDADNRLSGFNGGAVGVDADGNLTRGPALDGTVPGAVNFTYDARNRLTAHGGSSYPRNPDGGRTGRGDADAHDRDEPLARRAPEHGPAPRSQPAGRRLAPRTRARAWDATGHHYKLQSLTPSEASRRRPRSSGGVEHRTDRDDFRRRGYSEFRLGRSRHHSR